MKHNHLTKTLITLLLVSMMLCSFPCGAIAQNTNYDLNGDGEVLIGFLANSMSDHFTLMVVNGFERKLAELHPDWKFTVQDSNYDCSTELSITESYIMQGCDLVMIFCVDPSGSVGAVERLNEAGIPVVGTINVIDVDESQMVLVGVDNYNTGKALADYWRDKIPQNANTLIMQGVAGAQNSQDRVDGFLDNLNRDDIVILDQQYGQFQREMAMTIAENWIQAYDSVDFIYSCSDSMTPAIIEALEAADRKEGVLISSCDGGYEGVTLLAEGKFSVDAMFNYRTCCDLAIGAVERLLQGEKHADIGTILFAAEPLDRQAAVDLLASDYFEGSGANQ